MSFEVWATIIGAYALMQARAMGIPDSLGEYVAAWAVVNFIHRLVFLGQ